MSPTCIEESLVGGTMEDIMVERESFLKKNWIALLAVLISIIAVGNSFAANLGWYEVYRKKHIKPQPPTIRIENIDNTKLEKPLIGLTKHLIYELSKQNCPLRMLYDITPFEFETDLRILRSDEFVPAFVGGSANIYLYWHFPNLIDSGSSNLGEIEVPGIIERISQTSVQNEIDCITTLIDITDARFNISEYIESGKKFWNGEIGDIKLSFEDNIFDSSPWIELEVAKSRAFSKFLKINNGAFGDDYTYLGSCIIGIQLKLKNTVDQTIPTSNSRGQDYYCIAYDVFANIEEGSS